MPQIKEYSIRTSPGGPIAPPGRKAGNAGEYIAQGVEELGRGIGQAGEYVVKIKEEQVQRDKNQDTEDSKNFLSTHHSKYSTAWSEAISKADPNDKDLSKRFLEQYDKDASEFGSKLRTNEGKSFFTSNFTNLRNDFQKTAIAGETHLASVAAKQNYISALNTSSAGIMNDPSSFEAVRMLHEGALTEFANSAKIPREAALELQTKGNHDLAESAVRGWIRSNPSEAKAQLDAGTYDKYLGGDTKKALYGELTVEENAREVKKKQLAADNDKAVKAAQRATYDQFVGMAAKGSLKVDAVLNSNLAGEKKEHFIKVIEKGITNPLSMKTDPEKFHSLYERITGDENDPTAITSTDQLDAEFRNGGLSFSDLQKLNQVLDHGKTEEGKREQTQKNSAYTMMKETIYRGAGPKDPQAPELYLRAQQAYDAAYQEGISKGKSVTELTDPDFIKKVMKPFVRTPQAKLKDTAKIIQDYKAKTQGKKPKEKHQDAMEILKNAGLVPRG